MKYIIELEDEPRKELFADAGNYYRCKQRPFWFISEDTRDSLTPYTEPDRKAIEDAQEEAWSLAKKVALSVSYGGLSVDEMSECFGKCGCFDQILKNYSYQEAKAKYEAWKKEKDEIRVGDEVQACEHALSSVVVGIAYGSANLLYDGGALGQAPINELIKTGRHFPEVEELLNKMKE